jgi:hypothetical protein
MLSWFIKLVMAFLLGALTFTPWAILIVHFDIIEFSHSVFLGLPTWIPLAFGMMTLVTILFNFGLEKLLHTEINYVPANLAFEYLIIAGFYVSIIVLRSFPYILSLSLFAVIMIRLTFFHRSWDFLFLLFGACLVPTVELVLTSFKIYLFTEPDFLGMPYWLPLLWGEVALGLRRVSWVLYPPPPTRDEYFQLPRQFI